jgi:hypothetical protein
VKILSLLCFFTLVSCGDNTSYRLDTNTVYFSSDMSGRQSTTAGNLITTAIKEVNNIDIVLYPSEFLTSMEPTIVTPGMSLDQIEELAFQFPGGTKDQFMVGTMQGEDIKEFIRNRIQEKYQAELEVAGLQYSLNFQGGILGLESYSIAGGKILEDDRYYSVAFSKFFFFSGQTFPGYKYRNGIGFSFRDYQILISAKDSLKQYLLQTDNFPLFTEERALVQKFVSKDRGFVSIPQIQGAQHRSPLVGQRVTTRGVVTATSALQWYPGGFDFYMQDPVEDGDPCTSQAIHFYLESLPTRLTIGDVVEVTGTVYERMMGTGLGKTSIRDVTDVKVVGKLTEDQMPGYVKIGYDGRQIPTKHVSTYIGNLNTKPFLNPSDGVDFYECLEGMRVEFSNPRIVGFRGGKEDFDEKNKQRGYLTLYVVPDGDRRREGITPAGGIYIDEDSDDHNPEIITIGTNHLSRGVDPKLVYNVGDQLMGKVQGVLGYEKNIFGDGEYSVVMPLPQKILQRGNGQSYRIKSTKSRPWTKFKANEGELTIATLNLENLAGHQKRRLNEFGTAITHNLQCPDIVNLVEIQDINGIDFDGDANAEFTLKRLISYIECDDVSYDFVNIDPVVHNEGGQPGGNIRVAMIYNTRKLDFNLKQPPTSLTETLVSSEGNLNYNPGRVFPNDEVFERTRRSIVAQFSFKGRKVFVIGNHFNSKLGDGSFWQAEQPVFLGSEQKRAELAAKINDFVELIEQRDPNAYVIVAGDFNSLVTEGPMKVLEGETLTNLMYLIPPEDRYTTNHNGNSQPLDYIFVNKNLMRLNPESDVPHFNSNYMGRLSDHDPVVAKFRFFEVSDEENQ